MGKDVDIVVYDRSHRSIESISESLITLIMEASELIGEPTTRSDASEVASRVADRHAEFAGSDIWVTADDHGKTAQRDHVQHVLQDMQSGVRHLFVSASGEGISDVVETALQCNVVCHIVPISSGGSVMDEVINRRAGVGEEWSGRPPLGFEVRNGQLVRGEEYAEIVSVLRLVDKGDLSKRAAGDELGVARRTIGRALDNPERYQLQ